MSTSAAVIVGSKSAVLHLTIWKAAVRQPRRTGKTAARRCAGIVVRVQVSASSVTHAVPQFTRSTKNCITHVVSAARSRTRSTTRTCRHAWRRVLAACGALTMSERS